MKRKLTYIGTVLCCDCGTGYGISGPLAEYQDESGTVILCEECADESDDKSDIEDEEE